LGMNGSGPPDNSKYRSRWDMLTEWQCTCLLRELIDERSLKMR
jgi:hypothetical protein